MKINFTKDNIPEKGCLIILANNKISLGKQGLLLDKKLSGAITKAIKHQGFSGKKGEFISLLSPAGTKYDLIIVAGIGDNKDINSDNVRKLGGKLFSLINNYKISEANIITENLGDDAALIKELAVGASLKSYRFDKYKTKDKDKGKIYLSSLNLLAKENVKAKKLFEIEEAIIGGVFFTRDLVTEPANVLYPESYAEIIKKELTPLGIKVTIYDEKQMKKEGMGALLGVGQGSTRPPRLVILEWNGTKKTAKNSKDKPVAFVGKGVTFDTGGISIKPATPMWDMKYDMGGSAVVVGLMKSLALRKANIHAIGAVGLVENMPDGNAQRPGDVVTSMSGQTIEVLNTDAEGRLVLADVLTFVQKYHAPKFIVDLATLTGAIVVALGGEYAGLFSNNDKLANNLMAASNIVDEKIWRLPIGEVYDRMLDSPIADMQNISLDKGAGSITAAQFLHRFIENDVAWAHLDIAGVAWAEKDKDCCPKGASGFGVRLLNQLLIDNYE